MTCFPYTVNAYQLQSADTPGHDLVEEKLRIADNIVCWNFGNPKFVELIDSNFILSVSAEASYSS